jgi:ketosteroid isomerase-like protein
VAGAAIDTVKAFWDAHAAGDDDALVRQLAPDIVFRLRDGREFRGPTGFMAAIDDVAEQFRTYTVTPDRLLEVDDEFVVVPLRRVGVSHRGDTPITDRFTQVFCVHAGAIIRIQSFATTAEALAAVAM